MGLRKAGGLGFLERTPPVPAPPSLLRLDPSLPFSPVDDEVVVQVLKTMENLENDALHLQEAGQHTSVTAGPRTPLGLCWIPLRTPDPAREAKTAIPQLQNSTDITYLVLVQPA